MEEYLKDSKKKDELTLIYHEGLLNSKEIILAYKKDQKKNRKETWQCKELLGHCACTHMHTNLAGKYGKTWQWIRTEKLERQRG